MLTSRCHRQAHLRMPLSIARAMLGWFALVLAVAAASPLVQPRAMQMVCAADGAIRLLVQTDEGLVDSGQGQTLDCALCLLTNAPPGSNTVVPPALHLALAEGWATLDEPSVRYNGAPLPPRGPPRFS